MTIRLFAITAAVHFALAACGGSGKKGQSCQALEVTVDGSQVEMKKMLGLRESTGRGYTVQAFNHDEVSCQDAVVGRLGITDDSEISTRAFIRENGSTSLVRIGDYTQMMVKAKLLSTPKDKGDKVRICVERTEFEPTIGKHKEKSVVIEGLFEGELCASRRSEPR